MHPSLLGDRVDGRNNQQAWATRFSRSNPFQILAALTTVSRIDMIELQSFKNEALVSEDARQAWRESIDQLMKYCRKHIIGPGYLIYPPKHLNPENPRLQSKWELS